MRRGVPVVPPNSIIETYKYVTPERVQFIVTQDAEGLQPGSMIIKAGPWAHFFLDAWFDPLFRYYGFQKAEQHALVCSVPKSSSDIDRQLTGGL